ncbi:MAG: hypothetical protein J6P98_02450, partial [Clostridia bacterium]|nr:hypothetical protein [Clostridia bacterium]
MKKALIPILILAQLMMLAACSRPKETREIDALTEYAIADLRLAFESYYADPSGGEYDLYRKVSFDEAAEMFNSYLLRRIPTSNGEFVYTAYRVELGGVYYAQWSVDENGSPEASIDGLYLCDLPSERQLKRLHVGDPYSKLERIDNHNRFIFRLGLRPIAYSVADNGRVYGFELYD